MVFRLHQITVLIKKGIIKNFLSGDLNLLSNHLLLINFFGKWASSLALELRTFLTSLLVQNCVENLFV